MFVSGGMDMNAHVFLGTSLNAALRIGPQCVPIGFWAQSHLYLELNWTIRFDTVIVANTVRIGIYSMQLGHNSGLDRQVFSLLYGIESVLALFAAFPKLNRFSEHGLRCVAPPDKNLWIAVLLLWACMHRISGSR